VKKYNDIVVGSGVSGLTAALMLAQNNRKVLLLEKSSTLGGCMSRFYKNNIPFDLGFHFTGALSDNEILSSMLSALGIKDRINPIFIDGPGANTIVFENSISCDKGADTCLKFNIPTGIQNFRSWLKEKFQDEIEAIDSYMDFIEEIYDSTVALDLKNIDRLNCRIDEDYVTLEEMLYKLTKNEYLRSILANYCLCYGTEPSEMSYANHCRIVAAFYQSIARVIDGGDAFVDAFKEQFSLLNIDVCHNSFIEEFTEVEKRRVDGCVLNTGETVYADNYIFAIHPKEILKTLPPECLSRGFVNRISDFESTSGFFSLFCVLDDIDSGIDFVPGITTLYHNNDLNAVLGNSNSDATSLIIFKNIETDREGRKRFVMNVLETSSVDAVSEWTETLQGHRPQSYYLYKKNRVEKIIERVLKLYPEYRKKLKVVDSASILTYRDYLNSFDGAAYGIKQRIGQFNLFGKLPIRNIFAIGQSSILPGVVGAMISSFMLGRAILGEKKYNRYIERRTDS